MISENPVEAFDPFFMPHLIGKMDHTTVKLACPKCFILYTLVKMLYLRSASLVFKTSRG